MPTLIDLPETIAAGLTDSTKAISAEDIRNRIKVAIESET